MKKDSAESKQTPTKVKFQFLPSKCICSSNRLLANGQIHHHENCPDYIPTERERQLVAVIHSLIDGFDYNPGHSDLDDEQTEHLRITLGDYRKALRVMHRAEGR